MRMRDIAKAVGVSTMTVSRALRADASVAPATREAILQAVQQLGYVPISPQAGFPRAARGSSRSWCPR